MGVPLSSDEKNKSNEPTSYATVGPSSPTSSKEDELEAAETASVHPLCVLFSPFSVSPLFVLPQSFLLWHFLLNSRSQARSFRQQKKLLDQRSLASCLSYSNLLLLLSQSFQCFSQRRSLSVSLGPLVCVCTISLPYSVTLYLYLLL